MQQLGRHPNTVPRFLVVALLYPQGASQGRPVHDLPPRQDTSSEAEEPDNEQHLDNRMDIRYSSRGRSGRKQGLAIVTEKGRPAPPENAGEIHMSDEPAARPGAWKPGQSGNPRGKPKGVRNKSTRMVLALMERGAADITRAIIDAARNGDIAAARLVLERLAPPARERSITLDLPDTSTAMGVSQAQQVVLEAVGAGELLPGEGTTLAGILESRRKALEMQELERRVSELESRAHALELPAPTRGA